MSKKLKILCVCNQGNVRSAALKYLLWRQREIFPNEAVAVGVLNLSNSSMEYFINWADLVIDLHDGQEAEWLATTCKEMKTAYLLHSVGKDIWHNSTHPELHEKLYPLIKEIKETW